MPKPRTDMCVLTIDGKTYDVTEWVDRHPGGAVITQYDGKDATHAFHAFHSKMALQRLQRMTPLSDKEAKKLMHEKKQDARSRLILENFDKLKAEFEADGMFEPSAMWYTYKTLTTFAFLPIALVLHSMGWYLLSSILVGIMWQQLGWLGHEFCHHQPTTNRTFNHWFGLFSGNVAQGYSSAWWKDRHNSHHATTNIVDHDPDIDNIPVLAWAESDLDKAPEWAKTSIKYQAYYFLFVLPLLRIIWCINSIFFCLDMRTSRYVQYRKTFVPEALGLALHWIWVAALLASVPGFGNKVQYFLVSELLSGFGTGLVVFFNHYSCEKYDQALAGNFVCLQLFTTRNMTPGVITDWICGGLNYQIEHHLMPTMPRHNLTKASYRVRQFCKENELPYMSCGFWEGLGYVLGFLNEIATLAEKKFNKKE